MERSTKAKQQNRLALFLYTTFASPFATSLLIHNAGRRNSKQQAKIAIQGAGTTATDGPRNIPHHAEGGLQNQKSFLKSAFLVARELQGGLDTSLDTEHLQNVGAGGCFGGSCGAGAGSDKDEDSPSRGENATNATEQDKGEIKLVPLDPADAPAQEEDESANEGSGSPPQEVEEPRSGDDAAGAAAKNNNVESAAPLLSPFFSPDTTSTSGAAIGEIRMKTDLCVAIDASNTPRESHNIVFQGMDYPTPDAWQYDVSEVVRVLNMHEPYSPSQLKHLNIFRIDAPVPGFFCTFRKHMGVDRPACEELALVRHAVDKCGNGLHMSVITIVNRQPRINQNTDGYAESDFGSQVILRGIGPIAHPSAVPFEGVKHAQYAANVILHEMGHGTYGLGDEYHKTKSTADEFPNCDTAGCPKWKDLVDNGMASCEKGWCMNGGVFIGQKSLMIQDSFAALGHVNRRIACCKYLRLWDHVPPYCGQYHNPAKGLDLVSYCAHERKMRSVFDRVVLEPLELQPQFDPTLVGISSSFLLSSKGKEGGGSGVGADWGGEKGGEGTSTSSSSLLEQEKKEDGEQREGEDGGETTGGEGSKTKRRPNAFRAVRKDKDEDEKFFEGVFAGSGCCGGGGGGSRDDTLRAGVETSETPRGRAALSSPGAKEELYLQAKGVKPPAGDFEDDPRPDNEEISQLEVRADFDPDGTNFTRVHNPVEWTLEITPSNPTPGGYALKATKCPEEECGSFEDATNTKEKNSNNKKSTSNAKGFLFPYVSVYGHTYLQKEMDEQKQEKVLEEAEAEKEKKPEDRPALAEYVMVYVKNASTGLLKRNLTFPLEESIEYYHRVEEDIELSQKDKHEEKDEKEKANDENDDAENAAAVNREETMEHFSELPYRKWRRIRLILKKGEECVVPEEALDHAPDAGEVLGIEGKNDEDGNANEEEVPVVHDLSEQLQLLDGEAAETQKQDAEEDSSATEEGSSGTGSGAELIPEDPVPVPGGPAVDAVADDAVEGGSLPQEEGKETEMFDNAGSVAAGFLDDSFASGGATGEMQASGGAAGELQPPGEQLSSEPGHVSV